MAVTEMTAKVAVALNAYPFCCAQWPVFPNSGDSGDALYLQVSTSPCSTTLEQAAVVQLLRSMLDKTQGMKLLVKVVVDCVQGYQAFLAMVAQLVPLATGMTLSSIGLRLLPAVVLPLALTRCCSSVQVLNLELGPLTDSPLLALINCPSLMVLELLPASVAADPWAPVQTVWHARVILTPCTSAGDNAAAKLNRWMRDTFAHSEGLGVLVQPCPDGDVRYIGHQPRRAPFDAALSALVIVWSAIYPAMVDVRSMAAKLANTHSSALLIVTRVYRSSGLLIGMESRHARVNAERLRTITWPELQPLLRATRHLTAAASRHVHVEKYMPFERPRGGNPFEAVLLHLGACLQRKCLPLGTVDFARLACVLVAHEAVEVYGSIGYIFPLR